MKENIFKIIHIDEFHDYGWWHWNGSQPIHNGQSGLVVKTTEDFDIKDIVYLITCCSNCGDYTVIDLKDMSDDKIRDAVALKNNSK